MPEEQSLLPFFIPSNQITFEDVLKAVRAVDLETPRGRHTRGFSASTARQTPREHDDYEPWVLEVYTGTGRGQEYLVDMEAGDST
jgi:hypothetical protein